VPGLLDKEKKGGVFYYTKGGIFFRLVAPAMAKKFA
jgi:hypothetical protein